MDQHCVGYTHPGSPQGEMGAVLVGADSEALRVDDDPGVVIRWLSTDTPLTCGNG
ncbi:hypothetical protein K1Y78_47120 [Streptomyces sp. tea 10]|nr:hypothetical protein [Streptomyces sp. tea 10]